MVGGVVGGDGRPQRRTVAEPSRLYRGSPAARRSRRLRHDADHDPYVVLALLLPIRALG